MYVFLYSQKSYLLDEIEDAILSKRELIPKQSLDNNIPMIKFLGL